MMRLVLLSTLFLLVFTWEPNFHFGRRKYGLRLKLEQEEPAGTGYNTTGRGQEVFFKQKLDHFNATDNRTWYQRYFFNSQYANANSYLVAFLNLGGEGPESKAWVETESLPWLQWAKEQRAVLYSLEHRYYGRSRPFDTQSVENLQYLTSRQALADAAEFIRQMNKQPKMDKTRWIVFGGSYSGALALWMRQEYPYLVNGAVGSSAPLEAVVDFYQYLEVVQASLGNAAVGGGADCTGNVAEAFTNLTTHMNTKEGRATLNNIFKLNPGFDEFDSPTYNDIQNFYSTLIGNFQAAVQYSGDNAGAYATGYGIDDVCKLMNNPDPLQGLATVNVYMNTMDTKNPSTFISTPNNYTDMINYLQIEEYTDDDGFDSGARSWTWQSCSEAFGFFQTTDVTVGSIFGPISPLNLFINICEDVFGKQFTVSSISKAVDATNAYYGGVRGYRGTNVVIPNGSLDPWHALGGVYNYSSLSVVPYLIENTAHCADMYPERENETNTGILFVHNLISANIDKWINGPLINATATVVSDNWEQPALQFGTLPRSKRSFLQKITLQATVESHREAGQYPKFHLGRPPGGMRPAAVASNSVINPYINELTGITPRVDHFNKTNIQTFTQRAWVNSQWKTDNGSRFLMLGGESEEDVKWVSNPNLTWLTYAQQQGATAYLLEHRYYGQSKVSSDLKYLTSLQALYDIAHFIQFVNNDEHETRPWIVFGGSYSGALALWARQLFPNLIAGAVGSSGPIEAKLDFYEYLMVVEQSIRSYSNECADNIEEAFAEMHRLIQDTDGVDELNELFTLNPPFGDHYPLTEIHKQYFFQNIYGNFQGAVQYSGDNKDGYADSHGIPFLCSFMQNGTNTPLNNTADFNEAMVAFYTEQPFNSTDNDYEAFVEYLQKGGPTNEDAAVRLWTWQTCNEFGYFQSTDLGNGIFGSPTPVNLFTQLCKDVFFSDTDIDVAAYIANAVEITNKQYGGRDNYRGTNVVIPNGSLDPWHALGKYEGEPNNGSAIIKIEGTAHCADMYPARDANSNLTDPASLITARQKIGEFVAFWLQGGDEPEQPVDPYATTTSGTTDSTVAPTTGANDTPTTKTASAALALVTIVVSLLL